MISLVNIILVLQSLRLGIGIVRQIYSVYAIGFIVSIAHIKQKTNRLDRRILTQINRLIYIQTAPKV